LGENLKNWGLTYLIVLALFVILVFWNFKELNLVVFVANGDEIIDLLISFFVIALFLERAQEVFISSWRDKDRRILEGEVKDLKTKLKLKSKSSNKIKSELKDNQVLLNHYKSDTGRLAYKFSVTVGVLLAIVGVRSLQPLVDISNLAGFQKTAFHFIDVFLTAGLIGGGSDGIHKVISTFTDFLEKTKKQAKA